jgi:hypothetical protein
MGTIGRGWPRDKEQALLIELGELVGAVGTPIQRARESERGRSKACPAKDFIRGRTTEVREPTLQLCDKARRKVVFGHFEDEVLVGLP